MTKLEAIVEAYGEHYQESKSFINESGWMNSKEWLGGIGNTQIHSKLKGIELECMDNYDPKYCYWFRPKSLSGIENNNGWIKIESEETIPEQGVIVLGFSEDWIDEDFNPLGQRQCHYIGIYPDLEWISAKWWDYQDTWTNDEKTKPTHYQPIIQPLNPIY